MRIYVYYGILSGMSSDILSIQEEIFKLIGNQKRLEILLLLEHRELNVGEMTDMEASVKPIYHSTSPPRAQHLVGSTPKKGRESFIPLPMIVLRSRFDLFMIFFAKLTA